MDAAALDAVAGGGSSSSSSAANGTSALVATGGTVAAGNANSNANSSSSGGGSDSGVVRYVSIAIPDRYFPDNAGVGTTEPSDCGAHTTLYDEARALYGPIVLVADIMVGGEGAVGSGGRGERVRVVPLNAPAGFEWIHRTALFPCLT